jgi:hypothetical protein
VSQNARKRALVISVLAVCTLIAVPLFGQAVGTPYAADCNITFSGADHGSCNFTAVPAGKRLVVLEFDALGKVEEDNHPYHLFLNNTLAGSNYFVYQFETTFMNFDYLATHQETNLFVDQNMTPQCSVMLPSVSQGTYYCDISGVLQPR